MNWYEINSRNLPWKKTKNPYNIWLSEIILQQTRIEQGLPYYIKFIKAFPTIHDLAKSKEENIYKLWQGLGYYSRAQNLHLTAKRIVNEYNGVFPNSHEELKTLRGIGDYTASAIASICFDLPEAGNVNLSIYNLMGQKIRSLSSEMMTPGYHAIIWDGTNDMGSQVSTGMYFYSIQSSEFQATKKMLFLK